MSKPLQGENAFVTGSGRGLGFTIADRLAELGANLGIHDISMTAPAEFGEAKDLQEVADKMAARHGVKTCAVVGNIADPAAVKAMSEEFFSKLGTPTVLVNCAGGDIAAKGGKPNPNTALGISFEDMKAMVDRNLIGTMLVSQSFVPPMVKANKGSVINIASLAAHMGVSPEVVYSVCKAGIVHYTRCLCAELRTSGVRVNTVSPGPTMTARFKATRKLDPAMTGENGPSLIRYGKPEEVADVVGFLAGPASRFVNGQAIRVDGGGGLFA
jgi:3-oxoacyl-[acyl-carrier protein] reductase